MPNKTLKTLTLTALLALAGCATQTPAPTLLPPAPEAGQTIARFAEYASWLRQQGEPELRAELEKLETAGSTAERDLKLALLLGQRTAPTYDPERTARLLMQLATRADRVPLHAQIADILFGAQPNIEACQNNAELTAQNSRLSQEVAAERGAHADLQAQLNSALAQLEDARGDRARLERQLKALKSLEERIKDRDEAATP